MITIDASNLILQRLFESFEQKETKTIRMNSSNIIIHK